MSKPKKSHRKKEGREPAVISKSAPTSALIPPESALPRRASAIMGIIMISTGIVVDAALSVLLLLVVQPDDGRPYLTLLVGGFLVSGGCALLAMSHWSVSRKSKHSGGIGPRRVWVSAEQQAWDQNEPREGLAPLRGSVPSSRRETKGVKR